MGRKAKSTEYDERYRQRYGREVPYGDGDCFQTAIQVAIELISEGCENVRVCHGSPLGTGGEALGVRFPHAWVEVTEKGHDILNYKGEGVPELIDIAWAIDRSNGGDIKIPAFVYRAMGRVDDDVVMVYTHMECVEMLLRHQHYGPWH